MRNTLGEYLQCLLGLSGATMPVASQIVEALATTDAIVTRGDDHFTHPPWADGTSGSSDTFVEFASGSVHGATVWDDRRGWGAYTQLYVREGGAKLAEVEALVGPLQTTPTAPDDFRGRETRAAYPGRGIRVFVEHVKGDVATVLVHFGR